MDPLVVLARDVIAAIDSEFPGVSIRELAQWLGEDQRGVRRVMGQKWMTLHKADKWLTSLGLSYLLSDGSIPVVGNPRWNVVNWFNYMAERGCLEEGGE